MERWVGGWVGGRTYIQQVLVSQPHEINHFGRGAGGKILDTVGVEELEHATEGGEAV